MWDKQFERILREYLPFLPAEADLADDADLRDLGLDSLGMVELLASLESAYPVRFRSEALRVERLTTPAGVWQTLNSLLAPT